ncbi:trypsin-like peptidase domain-containing protein [Oceanicella actignis]|uniref:trypsin-like peptidase domain-containing protein n=1 Tax=Oceanicella actignis TaxID=1189325 RepID=UPI0012577786|nr:trypsin-like peptidase domain-containing protein [Oceanicella actignis]TYO90903.1 trypsin-like peptidase [Oceanicella actignis]
MSPDGGAATTVGPTDADWPALRGSLVAGVSPDQPAGALERLFRDAQTEREGGAPSLSLTVLRAGRPTDEPVAARIGFALDQARALGFLNAFVFELSQRVSVSPAFFEIARQLNDTGRPEDRLRLEALSDVFVGFDEPDQIIRGMQLGRTNTCLIEVRGDAGAKRGTGILIAPNLVLTTFHTFAGSGCLMSVPNPDGGPPGWKAAPGARANVTATFNHSRDFRYGAPSIRNGRKVPLAEDWLVSASGSDGMDPDHLDYAILRLEQAPPAFPRGFETARRGFPRTEADRARIHLFQHPEGAPLRVAAGSASRVVDELARIGHNANSLPGASGGACTDREFRVFAIHQGAVDDAPGGEQAFSAALGNSVNVAVPIHAILDHAGELPRGAVAASEALFVATPEGRRPLIGRAVTKDWIGDALRPEGKRILVVTGETGVGKSFTARILEAMLPDEDHEIRVLRENDRFHVMDPIALAGLLLRDEAAAAALPRHADSGMTVSQWARGPLMEAFSRAMRARLGRPPSAGGRPLWLVLDDLDKATIAETGGLRDFLYALYREAAQGDDDWLRVALLGFRGDFGALPSQGLEWEEVTEVAQPDIVHWLRTLDLALGHEDDAARRSGRNKLARMMMQLARSIPPGLSRIAHVAEFLGVSVLSYADIDGTGG